MHVGMVMECDYREGRTQEEAFAETLSVAHLAEASGIDGVWLVERLRALREELGLSGVIMEPNVGGRIAQDGMLRSIRLYAEELAPRLHGDEVSGIAR